MDVRIVRLQSGEDLIAEYDEQSEQGTVYLQNPMNLMFKRLPTGKAVMLMSPWLPLELIEGSGTWLYSQDVLTVMQPKPSLIKYYHNSITELQQEMLENEGAVEESLENSEQSEFDFSDLMEQEEYGEEEPTDEEMMEELKLIRQDIKKKLLH